MKLRVDRDLPVPLGLQVRGMIEYGIVSGELMPGERLPSVRELAETLGVAPMTVAQVYRYLRDGGLIETRSGRGTFIAERNHAASVSQPRLLEVQRRLDLLIRDALEAGLAPGDVAGMVQTLLARREQKGAPRRILMVGMFPLATREYAQAIQDQLGGGFVVEPRTIDELRRNPAPDPRDGTIELALTFPNRRRQIAALAPHLRVVGLRFLPSEPTRQALAALDPFTRLGVVSHFDDFLSMLKAGVERFAPHVQNLRAAVADTPEMEAVLAWSDVVVLSTGAEAVAERLQPGIRAIEYRYSPDPVDIDQTIVPLLSAADG
jgi:DNA-binding transcriptional regulator YhcF (GntR family)